MLSVLESVMTRKRLAIGFTLSFVVAAGTLWFSIGRVRLDVHTDRPQAIYSRGQEIQFRITATQWMQPLRRGVLAYSLARGQQTLASGQLDLSQNQQPIVSWKQSEPGFVAIRVVHVADSRRVAEAVAAVAPEEIVPDVPAPDDFDAFWEHQLARLADVPMEPQLTPVTHFHRGVEVFDTQLACVDSSVSGYLARPAGAQPGTLPALLRFHGAGVSGASIRKVVRGARNGMLCMDVNAHGIANGRNESFYTRLADTDLKDYKYFGCGNRTECYFLGMYLRAKRAVEFLTSQPEWDGEILIVDGNSQGAAQAIAAAALDSRVTMISAGVPALANQLGEIKGWPKLMEAAAEQNNHLTEPPAAGYFDIVYLASRTSAEVIASVGFMDNACPPSSVYMAFNQFPGRKKMLNRPQMKHQAPRDVEDLFFEAFADHIRRRRSRQ